MNGTIKKLTDRGYGFIAPEGEDRDIFFHANALEGVEFNDLREGDAVTFEVEDGPKGPSAVNVTRGADAADTADEASDEEEVAEEMPEE